MSMTVITALQILGLLVIYTVISIVIPHIVVGKTLRFRNRYERFMLYTMFGNFYVINLVYILELLHISHWTTLLLFTVVPLAAIKIKIENIPFKKNVGEKWENLRRLAGGQLKFRAFRDAGADERKKRRAARRKSLLRIFSVNIPELILCLGLVGATFYTFGFNLFWHYGYKLTDVVVHNYWINQLSENNIFAKGVYPFGYHNIIYYIHALFGFDTYVILRVFNIVIVLWIDLLLLCFLKLLCKSRFLPFIAAYGYVIFDYYEGHTYARFCALIPQEYGMLFVLPSIYCGFAYFREQRREINGSVAKKSSMYLAGFAVSFSLTLAAHFYGTIATGIYIVAMAIAFVGWLFRRPYFKKIICTFLMSLFIAILPMGIAYATGTELEYSLKWALSVMTGTPLERDDDTTQQGSNSQGGGEEQQEEEQTVNIGTPFRRILPHYTYSYGKVKGTAYAIWYLLEDSLDYAAIKYDKASAIYGVLGCFVVMIALGLGFLFTRQGDKIYGGVILSTGLYMMFMVILLAAGNFGLPQLMDLNRASIYFTYTVGAGLVLFADAILYVLVGLVKMVPAYIGRGKIKLARDIMSFLVLGGVMFFVFETGAIREQMNVTAFESNDAITCLTKIISDTKDREWTIVSANDEGRMVYNHGFHYELIDFLRAMEIVGSRGWIRIPSKVVYFFVEKNPIDYYVSWEGSGTPIGEEYANMPLPLGNNRALYEGMNRWICMSRYYYWAEAFKELYPNETSIFFETEDFICYRVEQNTYRLFNFAIDYGYNVPDDVVIGDN